MVAAGGGVVAGCEGWRESSFLRQTSLSPVCPRVPYWIIGSSRMAASTIGGGHRHRTDSMRLIRILGMAGCCRSRYAPLATFFKNSSQTSATRLGESCPSCRPTKPLRNLALFCPQPRFQPAPTSLVSLIVDTSMCQATCPSGRMAASFLVEWATISTKRLPRPQHSSWVLRSWRRSLLSSAASTRSSE